MATSIPLIIAIALVMVDSALELSFISSMVSWLHFTASGTFAIRSPGSGVFNLRGEPLDLMTDQGHTSNGAAGTGFVLIGFGGIIALWLRSKPSFHRSWLSSAIYHLWLAINVPALLLTIGALAYVFVVTNTRKGQEIDVRLAQTLAGKLKYPEQTWTPQNWYNAVLKLDIADSDVRADIASHYRVMLGWQYNLIAMVVVQLAETVLAFVDFSQRRREDRKAMSAHVEPWKV